jgi:transcriptional repressor NrdR
VVDSRPLEENNSIRRRRECLECHGRFTTYEIIEEFHPVVVKKNGSKELFDKNKLLSGLLKACQKRPVDADKVAAEVEAEIRNSLKQEISSAEIGDMVMERLRSLDDVAYVRFASVHREFKDIDKFMEELTKLKSEKDSACSE